MTVICIIILGYGDQSHTVKKMVMLHYRLKFSVIFCNMSIIMRRRRRRRRKRRRRRRMEEEDKEKKGEEIPKGLFFFKGI